LGAIRALPQTLAYLRGRFAGGQGEVKEGRGDKKEKVRERKWRRERKKGKGRTTREREKVRSATFNFLDHELCPATYSQ